MRSFQAKEEVDLDGLLSHFMTPPGEEKEASTDEVLQGTRFGAKNTLLDCPDDATSAF